MDLLQKSALPGRGKCGVLTMHRISQKHFSSQGEKGSESPLRGASFENLSLSELSDSAYSAIVQPQRVVVIPRYFLIHWLPLLGPARAWLALAFRQAAFVVRSSGGEVLRQVSVRQLARWSGLGHSQAAALLTDPGPLAWFARKVGTPQGRGEGATWGVQVDVPVAPHHLRLLAGFLSQRRKHSPKKAKEIQADLHEHLNELLAALPELLAASPAPASALNDPAMLASPLTLHKMVAALYNSPLDSPAANLCDEIAARIVQPGSTFAITHYFIDHWLPAFRNGEAWLALILRALVYKGGEGAGSVTVEGGKTRLAALLGVTDRTVRRWLSAENTPLALFCSWTATSTGMQFSVNLKEPIHPDDHARYAEVLAACASDLADKTGQFSLPTAGRPTEASLAPAPDHLTESALRRRTKPDRTPEKPWTKSDTPRTMTDSALDKIGHTPGKNGQPGQTKPDSRDDNGGQPAGQKRTAPRTAPDTTMGLNQKQDFSIQNSINLPQPDLENRAQAGGGGGGWDLERIFQAAGMLPETRENVIQALSRQPAAHSRLVGWLIYAYAHASTGQGGIRMPVQFALSRYTHSEPAPLYAALAEYPPAQLSAWLVDPYARLPDPTLRPVLDALASSDLAAFLSGTGVFEPVGAPEMGAAAEDSAGNRSVKPPDPIRHALENAPAAPAPMLPAGTAAGVGTIGGPALPTCAVLCERLYALTGTNLTAGATLKTLEQGELLLVYPGVGLVRAASECLNRAWEAVQADYPGLKVRLRALGQPPGAVRPSLQVLEEVVFPAP